MRSLALLFSLFVVAVASANPAIGGSAKDQVFYFGEGLFEEVGVVAYVLDGGVDFVGNAGRQLSDRLQFLRLAQLRFELLALRDILRGPNNAHQLIVLAVKRFDLCPNNTLAAIRLQNGILRRGQRIFRETVLDDVGEVIVGIRV